MRGWATRACELSGSAPRRRRGGELQVAALAWPPLSPPRAQFRVHSTASCTGRVSVPTKEGLARCEGESRSGTGFDGGGRRVVGGLARARRAELLGLGRVGYGQSRCSTRGAGSPGEMATRETRARRREEPPASSRSSFCPGPSLARSPSSSHLMPATVLGRSCLTKQAPHAYHSDAPVCAPCARPRPAPSDPLSCASSPHVELARLSITGFRWRSRACTTRTCGACLNSLRSVMARLPPRRALPDSGLTE